MREHTYCALWRGRRSDLASGSYESPLVRGAFLGVTKMFVFWTHDDALGDSGPRIQLILTQFLCDSSIFEQTEVLTPSMEKPRDRFSKCGVTGSMPRTNWLAC